LHASTDQQFTACTRGGTGSQTHQACFFNFLALNFQGIQHASNSDDSGTMLVIVKHGDIALLNQNALDLKALRSLNIFQIDTTKGISNSGDRVDKGLRAFRVDFDVKHVNTSEALEQHTLAFHYRLA